jgi:hypothetical protein
MIGNDHVRFGRGPSGKGLAAASNSPDGLPHLHPSPARHAEHARSQRATTSPTSLNVTAVRQPRPEAETTHLPGIG